MNEELLKMYAELTQEVSLCQDEDIKALGKGILELANNYDKSLKEIKRLNNIINELEEEINFKIKGIEIKFNSYEELCKNAGNFGGYINLKSIKDKLQELKGDSNE